MNKGQFFNAVIIDTNAFDAKGNDFCGYFNSIIPSLFSSLSEHNIKIISHPVLIGETKKHIKYGIGGQTNNQKVLNMILALTRNKSILDLIHLDYDAIILQLEQLNLDADNLKKVKKYFSNAEILPYSDPAIIFEKYFNAEPPFAKSGDKKSEFPDAFIIESIVDYLNANPTVAILVISNDNDWKSALSPKEQITMVDNIDDALKLLYSQEQSINDIIETLYEDIADYFINNTITETWFDIYDYDLESDIDIEKIELDEINNNIVPLVISESKIVLQTTVDLLVDGATTIFDYDNSVWDSETRTYYFTSFAIMDFQQASGTATCEIHISFDKNKKPSLEKIHIIAPYGVMLTVDEEKVDF
ncbi:MAG: PIN domain-containing protein, partial [Ruminococcus flavefaciens]|nr:PIN domain-containing protein [Ruminococcus flavefaciens]